jgi:tetratricopeptide (TPR) repeat protein/tRNA A-37 threonylcarbamoyl transferase component Bud32
LASSGQSMGAQGATPFGGPSAAERRVFADGAVVSGRYRIVRYLNRGGMGEVYQADDLELKERIALKTLLPELATDPRMITRFKAEIQLSRKISHPNVCRVFDLARTDELDEPVYFLTMEFLEGETLAGKMRREGRIAVAEALPLLDQMAQGLGAAHRAGVLHRDFKPSNVMLVPSHEGARAVVTDFGLARRYLHPTGETTASLTGQVMGTLEYMAPELLTGTDASVASDVYALGMVAYRMVAGTAPYPAETPMAGAILRAKHPIPRPRTLLPSLDSRWDLVITRALERKPSARFADPADFVAALRGSTAAITVPFSSLTRRGAIWAIAGIILAIAGVASWRMWLRSQIEPSPEAVRLFQTGVDDIHAGAYFAATKALGDCVRLAPWYSLARARLADAWLELDLPELAKDQMILARRQDISRLPEKEQMEIEAVDKSITREFAAARALEERIAAIAAPNEGADVDLGRAYQKEAKLEQAVTAYRKAADGPLHLAGAFLRLAVIDWRAGRLDKAASEFDEAERRYQFDSKSEGLTEVAFQRGYAANSHGDYDAAAQFLEQAMQTAHAVGNLQQEIRAKLQLATNAYMSGDSALAERDALEALDTARVNRLEALAVTGLVKLGSAYQLKRDYTGAEKYYRDALKLARANNSQHLTALSLVNLAALHDQLKRAAEIASEAKEALDFYQPSGYLKESAQCLTLLGRSSSYKGDYVAASDFFNRAAKMAEKSQDKNIMALAEESLGSVLKARELYPEALIHYQKRLALSVTPESKAYGALQSALILSYLGRFGDADRLLDLGAVEGKFAALHLMALRFRSSIALSRNRYSQAADLAREGMASGSGADPMTTASLKRYLGLALVGLGSKKEGLRLCREAISVVENSEDVVTKLGLRVDLMRALVAGGDPAEAARIFESVAPALAGLPETQYRALALMARVDSQFNDRARDALENLHRLWGEDAFRSYLSRPDLQPFSRSSPRGPGNKPL